jgi:hypothetical protein
MLDHAMPLKERHPWHLGRGYVSYSHQDRIHNSLGKDTPNRRRVERQPPTRAIVISIPRLGCLHPGYGWLEAAWLAQAVSA